ncbi:unnamed protein product [Lota lota]
MPIRCNKRQALFHVYPPTASANPDSQTARHCGTRIWSYLTDAILLVVQPIKERSESSLGHCEALSPTRLLAPHWRHLAADGMTRRGAWTVRFDDFYGGGKRPSRNSGLPRLERGEDPGPAPEWGDVESQVDF